MSKSITRPAKPGSASSKAAAKTRKPAAGSASATGKAKVAARPARAKVPAPPVAAASSTSAGKVAGRAGKATRPATAQSSPITSTAKAAAAAGKVAIGKKVPAFSALATGGEGGRRWRLADAAGRNLVLYFYPRDNTTGCTREGEAFRDLHARFVAANTLVLGVSPDSLASHERFKARHDFPFELLADEQRELCELFGVYKEKTLYGRKYMGVERSTFLIDAKGVLRQQWRNVKVPGHVEAVLAAAQALSSE